jgi:hypothetical protein
MWRRTGGFLQNTCKWDDFKRNLQFYTTAVLRLIRTYHAVPLPFPYRAMPLRVEIVSFPFDLHSAAVFDSHMPFRVHAAPVPYNDHAVRKATSQRHGTARHGHDMACVN